MIIDELRRDIKKHDKPGNQIDAQQFFKEKLKKRFVLKAPIARKISNTHFKKIRDLSKKEILDICDELLEAGGLKFYAFEWAIRLKDQYEPKDFARFEKWLKLYVDSWATCDHLSGAIGPLVFMYPELLFKIKKWTKSKSRWIKRMSAVALIYAVRRGKYLDDVFKTADILLRDEDDMVQKGYGWMLKDASNAFPDEIFDYVIRNKRDMPRTALRYAIEKLPLAKKKQAMKKDWL